MGSRAHGHDAWDCPDYGAGEESHAVRGRNVFASCDDICDFRWWYRKVGDGLLWPERRGFNEAQRARVENIGVLVASGMIAGEAMVGLDGCDLPIFRMAVCLRSLRRRPLQWGRS